MTDEPEYHSSMTSQADQDMWVEKEECDGDPGMLSDASSFSDCLIERTPYTRMDSADLWDDLDADGELHTEDNFDTSLLGNPGCSFNTSQDSDLSTLDSSNSLIVRHTDNIRFHDVLI